MTNHIDDGERKGMDNQCRGGRGHPGQSTWDAAQEYLDAQRETLIPEIMWLMERVNDASIALPQRFELASRAMAKLTGIFLSEALAPVADAERSVILSRLTIHLKAIIDTLARKKEIEAYDAFNPSSPKFQTCFGWFLEVVHEALTAEVDTITTNNVFARITTALIDWEEKLPRQLKRLAGHAPPSNPFIREIEVKSLRVHMSDGDRRANELKELSVPQDCEGEEEVMAKRSSRGQEHPINERAS
jgi:hypothetical protein